MCKTWKHGFGLGAGSAALVGVPQKSRKCQGILHGLDSGHPVYHCSQNIIQLSWKWNTCKLCNCTSGHLLTRQTAEYMRNIITKKVNI